MSEPLKEKVKEIAMKIASLMLAAALGWTLSIAVTAGIGAVVKAATEQPKPPAPPVVTEVAKMSDDDAKLIQQVNIAQRTAEAELRAAKAESQNTLTTLCNKAGILVTECQFNIEQRKWFRVVAVPVPPSPPAAPPAKENVK